jgi:AcrR family transcriptional regulator
MKRKKKRHAKPQTKLIRHDLHINSSYHHGQLRESLISAALKFIENNPLEKLSLRALASKAGVSQAAPYRHFKDRNAVLAAISQQGFELKFKYMLESFIANHDRPKELIHGCAQAFFKMGLLHPQHFKLMLTSHVCPSPDYPDLEAAAGLAFGLLKKTILICQSAGIVGAGDPYHQSMHCWAMISGFTTLYIEGRLNWLGVNEENAKDALRMYVEQFLTGHKTQLAPQVLFKLFNTEDSKQSLEKLNAVEMEINRILETTMN